MPIRAILTDIEGTTSSVSFVYDVLFPYARQHLPAYLRAHADEPEVAAQLAAVRRDAGEPGADLERVIAILLAWMDADRKVTPLKALQGMVWREGYRAGEIRGHVYPDAVEALRAWKQQGLGLYVYSSGSVQAQRLIFGCSEAGDLTPLFSGYFDTEVGHKRDPAAYRRILGEIGHAPDEVLFLSDVIEELDAAREAGLQTCGLAREGGELSGHRTVNGFDKVGLDADQGSPSADRQAR